MLLETLESATMCGVKVEATTAEDEGCSMPSAYRTSDRSNCNVDRTLALIREEVLPGFPYNFAS
jgi:hypothetical protein